jgi:protein TonB
LSSKRDWPRSLFQWVFILLAHAAVIFPLQPSAINLQQPHTQLIHARILSTPILSKQPRPEPARKPTTSPKVNKVNTVDKTVETVETTTEAEMTEEPVKSLEDSPQIADSAHKEVLEPPVFNADYLDNPSPQYPGTSRFLGEKGRVVLQVLVSAEGRAEHIEIRESSGHQRLDQSAQTAVQGWRFVPARRGNRPEPAWVLVPVIFNL